MTTPVDVHHPSLPKCSAAMLSPLLLLFSSAVFNALFTELLKADVNWPEWKGERCGITSTHKRSNPRLGEVATPVRLSQFLSRFSDEILDSWLVLKGLKFMDSAVPGPEEIDEDIIEVC